jgi:hypothetical protein
VEKNQYPNQKALLKYFVFHLIAAPITQLLISAVLTNAQHFVKKITIDMRSMSRMFIAVVAGAIKPLISISSIQKAYN